MKLRTFAISSDLFSYYEKEINVEYINSIEDIILLIVSDLDKLFRENNLVLLSEKLRERKFHVHDFTIDEIKNSNDKRIYYICDHC